MRFQKGRVEGSLRHMMVEIDGKMCTRQMLVDDDGKILIETGWLTLGQARIKLLDVHGFFPVYERSLFFVYKDIQESICVSKSVVNAVVKRCLTEFVNYNYTKTYAFQRDMHYSIIEFLCHAKSYRGAKAVAIKKELRKYVTKNQVTTYKNRNKKGVNQWR